MRSLPTPLSPVMSTLVFTAATRVASASTDCIGGELAMRNGSATRMTRLASGGRPFHHVKRIGRAVVLTSHAGAFNISGPHVILAGRRGLAATVRYLILPHIRE